MIVSSKSYVSSIKSKRVTFYIDIPLKYAHDINLDERDFLKASLKKNPGKALLWSHTYSEKYAMRHIDYNIMY